MAINKVEIFNAKPIKTSSIERNPFFERHQKKNVKVNKGISSVSVENKNPDAEKKIDVVG